MTTIQPRFATVIGKDGYMIQVITEPVSASPEWDQTVMSIISSFEPFVTALGGGARSKNGFGLPVAVSSFQAAAVMILGDKRSGTIAKQIRDSIEGFLIAKGFGLIPREALKDLQEFWQMAEREDGRLS